MCREGSRRMMLSSRFFFLVITLAVLVVACSSLVDLTGHIEGVSSTTLRRRVRAPVTSGSVSVNEYYATCSYPSLSRPLRIYQSYIVSHHGCGREGQRRTTEEMVRVFPLRAIIPILT
jgi:hypothetical protein